MPQIQDVTLEDVLADGRDLGKTPAEIAEGVRKWRGLTLDWAARNRADADPEKYVQGVDTLDKATDTALNDLRGEAAKQWAESTFKDRPQDYPAFLFSLEAGDVPNDPYAAEKQQLRELQQAFRKPKGRQANQWEPLADKNGNELGRMQFIDRGAEQDVLLNLRTDSFGGRKAVRVPIPSVQDAEIEQAAAAAEAEAAKLKDQAVYHLSFPPETGYNGVDAANELERQAKLQTQRAATLRSPQGRSLLTSERVMQAVRENPELSKQVGQRGLGEDFYRGLAQFFVSSRVAFNDVTGDTTERDQWRQHLESMRQYFPGSTGPANTEGVAGFVSDAAAGAGGMVPQVLSMAAGGVPGMGSAAVRGIGAASMGSMGVSAYGGAVDETLSRADAMDAEAQKLEATDPQGAQQLREQAAGLRENYRGIAAAKAGVEVASEFILPEHRLLRAGGTGAMNRVANATVKSLGEGAAAEIGSQAVNNAVFGDPIDLGQIARGAALEAAAGAPMIAASAFAPNAAAAPSGQPEVQTPAVETPPAAEMPSTIGGRKPLIAPASAEEQQAIAAMRPGYSEAALAQAPRSLLEIAQRAGQAPSPLNPPAATSPAAMPPASTPGSPTAASAAPMNTAAAGGGEAGVSGTAMVGASPSNAAALQQAANPPAASPGDTMAVNVGDIVAYEGYAGRLMQEGERLAIHTAGGEIVEVADPQGLTRVTDPQVTQQVHLAELRQMGAQEPVVSEARFQGTVTADGKPALLDEKGRLFVPHNPQLLRTVRQGPNGIEVLMRNPQDPGRIIKLTGAQAMQAQDALLNAAEQIEARGGKVNWGTAKAPRLQFSQTLGKLWNKLPVTIGAAPLRFVQGKVEALVAHARDVLRAGPLTVEARDGRQVALIHPAQGTEETLFRHLVTDSKGNASPERAAWVARIAQTLQQARVRVTDGGSAVYIARYSDRGRREAHFVVVHPDGYVSAQGPLDALWTHWPRIEQLAGRATRGGDQIMGRYENLPATQFTMSAVTPATSDGGATTGTRANVSEQSVGTPGYTVWADPASGLTPSQATEMLHEVLRKPAAKSTGKTPRRATRAAVLDALKLLKDRLPGLQNQRVLAFANRDEFLASGYAREQSFDAEEIAAMADAEGFYDTRTGHTIVFTEQIELREGETPIRAVARVLLHERVGHDGLNTLIAQDASHAARWNKIASLIPAAELDAIAAEAGYTHLAGDRAQLALEWLARKVESVEGARNAIDIERSLAGIARQLWQALKEMLARAFAGFSRSAAFAHEVHEIINLARDAAMKGSADPTTPAGLLTRVQFSLGGTRVRHAPGTPYRVNDRAWRSILTGSALPSAFHDTIQATERERRALDQACAQIGNDLKAAAEGYASRSGQPIADVYEMLNQALSGAPGTNAVLMQVDPVLHTRALAARNLMDQLSVAIAATMPVGPLRNAIVLNQGAWMRRSFAAFDPASGWNYDALVDAAKAGKQFQGKPAADILRKAQAFLRQQNPQASAAEIESDLRDLMDRDVIGNALAGSAAVRKNISSLIARKEIPKELRDVMGEEHNPVKRFLQSTSFQAQFIHRHQQQTALRRIGLANGLFSTQRGGVFTERVPTETARWSGMQGVWTTPQLWQAMQEMSAAEAGTDLWSKAGEALKFLGNEAKLNRVAMNPDSWIVNMLGNVVALVQTGDVFYSSFFRRVGEAVALHRSGKGKSSDAVDAAAEAVQEAQRALVARLTASGVIGESFTLRDLEASLPRHLLAWANEDMTRDRTLGALKGAIAGQAAGRGLGIAGRLAGGAIGAVVGSKAGLNRIQQWQQTLAGYVMTGPDAIGRLTGFLGNYEVALASGLSPDAAFAQASERTRNTFPDYSKLPAVLKTLSRYGVAGSFIGFQYEVYRNAIWNLRYATEELRSGNPALVRKGIARTVGASAVGILAAGGLQAIFQGLAGTDDERNQKWRKWFAAPWEKNGVIVFTDYTDKGVSYFNTSYLIPQATLAELVEAAYQGTDPADAAGRIASHVWEQFMGSSVHLGPILAAYTNQDRFGRPITHEQGLAGVAERLDSAMQTMLEPGWAAKFERLEYALREAEKKGRLFSVEEEVKRLVGVREFTRTWPDMVKRGYDNFAKLNTDIRSAANREIGLNLPGGKEKAIREANATIQNLRAEMAAYETDLQRLGVPPSIVRKARQDSPAPNKFYDVEIDPETKNRVRSKK